jgi:ribonuclease P protein component
MKKKNRVKRREDFSRLLSQDRLYAGRCLIAFGSIRQDGERRVGIACTRKIAGAVGRNRARRRIREAVRLALLTNDSPFGKEGIGFDMVVIARPDSLKVPLGKLLVETLGAASALERRA